MNFILVIVLCLLLQGCVTFLTNPGSGSEGLQFVAMGDWGGLSFHPFTTPVQMSIERQMARLGKTNGTDFNLLLGDNFYLYGIQSVDDPRIQETFEDVYTDSSHHIPWYIVGGNHDYFGNISAQIAYSKRSSRWIFPDYYQSIHKTTSTGTSIDVIMIDTIQLCGNVYRAGVQPQGPTDKQAADAQWTWIEQQLNTSTADYLLVAGHFPIQSVAEHGPTDCLVNKLEPLLYQYNVTAYLAGHDHNLQHIQMTNTSQTMDYIVAGCANFVNNKQKHDHTVPQGALKFFWGDYLHLGGFSYYDVTDSYIRMSFISGDGHILYQHDMTPRTV